MKTLFTSNSHDLVVTELMVNMAKCGDNNGQ